MAEDEKVVAPPQETPPADVVVQVDDAPPAEGEKVAAPPPEQKKPDELDSYSEAVQRRMNKLTAKLREAERREQAALDYARGVLGENEQLKERNKTVDTSYVGEFESRITAQENALKHNMKVAMANQDVEQIAEINNQMAQLAVDKYRLQAAKQQREAETARAAEMERARQENARRQPPPQQAPQAPPQPDPRAVKWAEDNVWFGKDQPMTLTAFAIHKTLIEDEGINPATDEYYQEIDKRMRQEWPHKFQQNGQQRTYKTPVAPANNTIPPQTQKKEIKLTPSQIAIAKKLGVSVEAYAKQVLKLQKERTNG